VAIFKSIIVKDGKFIKILSFKTFFCQYRVLVAINLHLKYNYVNMKQNSEVTMNPANVHPIDLSKIDFVKTGSVGKNNNKIELQAKVLVDGKYYTITVHHTNNFTLTETQLNKLVQDSLGKLNNNEFISLGKFKFKGTVDSPESAKNPKIGMLDKGSKPKREYNTNADTWMGIDTWSNRGEAISNLFNSIYDASISQSGQNQPHGVSVKVQPAGVQPAAASSGAPLLRAAPVGRDKDAEEDDIFDDDEDEPVFLGAPPERESMLVPPQEEDDLEQLMAAAEREAAQRPLFTPKPPAGRSPREKAKMDQEDPKVQAAKMSKLIEDAHKQILQQGQDNLEQLLKELDEDQNPPSQPKSGPDTPF
jgi:hypothetical protein